MYRYNSKALYDGVYFYFGEIWIWESIASNNAFGEIICFLLVCWLLLGSKDKHVQVFLLSWNLPGQKLNGLLSSFGDNWS